MYTAHMTTLFAEPAVPRKGLSSFALSLLLHGVAFALILLGLRRTLRIEPPADTRYTVRLMNLKQPEPKLRAYTPSAPVAPSAQTAEDAGSRGSSSSASPSVPKQLAQAVPAQQTLVQPELPPNLLLQKEIPLPQVLLWSADANPLRKIVAPRPEAIASATTRPSLTAPNHELRLADIKVSSSDFSTSLLPILPSATTPVNVRRAEQAELIPQTTSASVDPPTPAAVMSLSDIQLRQGTIAVPLANQTAVHSNPSTVASLQARGNADGNTPDKAEAVKGEGKEAGAGRGKTSEHAAIGKGSGASSAAGSAGAQAGAGQGEVGPSAGNPEGTASPTDDKPYLARVRVPKDGHFGVVVVGSSLADDYPETVGVWNGRLAYSVYVHVGLAKSWILQYSLPRTVLAAAAGNATRPEAPWPYDMTRPHFADGDTSGDAIMIHGFVNTEGKFEKMAVVFPPDMRHSDFLLDALDQWRFRPAMQNGQIASVEVLLIIPEEQE